MDSTKPTLDPRLFTPPMGMAIQTSPQSDDDEEAKRRRKEKKALDAATQPLDPWQRYKALSDVLDAGQDMIDLADHKARFALLIMGALNAGVFLASARAPAGSFFGSELGRLVGVGLLAYAVSALYFFAQAIEALRPRGKPGMRPLPTEPIPDVSLGMRFYHDILERSADEYQRLWSVLKVDNLNAEISGQVHVVAEINRDKYAALRRLYTGLKVMTVLAAAFLLGLLVLINR
jgi:hypothetical protein